MAAYTGDISKYRRQTFLKWILYLGFILIVVGFVFNRYAGLSAIIIVLTAAIYALWTIPPDSNVILFMDDKIRIYKKGVLMHEADYNSVRRLICDNAYRSGCNFQLNTQSGSFSFQEQDGESWEKLADNLIKYLKGKNKSVGISYRNFYDSWDK